MLSGAKFANALGKNAEISQLNIFSSPALEAVLPILVREYSRNYDSAVNIAFLGSDAIISQISYGEPADLVISEDDDLFEELAISGFLDIYSKNKIINTDLLIAKPKGSDININNKESLSFQLRLYNENAALGIIDPLQSYQGKLSKDLLGDLDDWQLLTPIIMYHRSSNRLLENLANDKVNVGIIYSSDLYRRDDIVIAMDNEQINNSNQITFTASVVASENMDNGRKFLEFLQSDLAQKIFRQYGFR